MSSLFSTTAASKTEKDREQEDLTYLIVRAKHPKRGVTLLSRQADSITYPECFVGIWVITLIPFCPKSNKPRNL